MSTMLIKDCGSDAVLIAESLMDVRDWLIEHVSPLLDDNVSMYDPPNHTFEQAYTNDLNVEAPYSPVLREVLKKVPSIGERDLSALGMVEVLHGKEWWACITRHRYRERDGKQYEYRLYLEVPDDATAVQIKLKFF